MKVLIIILFAFLPMRSTAQKKKIVALAISGQAAAWADMTSTQEILRKGGVEKDPLAEPFTKLSRTKYYAAGTALTAGVSLLGIAMLHTQRFHRAWWMPQTLQVGINFGFSAWNLHWIREH